MPPRRKLTPSYVLHKQSGRGRLVWTDASGTRQQKLLPGLFGSRESLAAKARLELELATSPTATVANRNAISLAELLCAYLDYAQSHYRGTDGRPTKELENMKVVIRALRELYADLPASEFGPQKLKAVRQRTIDAGLCRSLINHRIDRARRIFKWAASEELVPVAFVRVHCRCTADHFGIASENTGGVVQSQTR